ncbi:hypothetical protein CMI45_02685 [Candidatus Pacearchaeota archaeon]|nr:hypothetical protein [Candidatus Pacearchaeota archaeon]
MSQDNHAKKEKTPETLTGELNSNKKYEPNMVMPGMPAGMGKMPQMPKQKTPEEVKAEFEALKKKLENVKKKILKKYKFTKFLSVLPGVGLPLFAEDEGMPVEVEKTNPTLLLMCIPEEQFKDINKIKDEVVKIIKESKENVWLLVKTEVDLWNYGLDSKFDLMDLVSGSFPLYDNGFLGALRLANIHKSLVLRKFEKYVATYAIGGSLVRGVADKDSDFDCIVIIDDTDVKRMPRLELLEKLRAMIHDYIREAMALAGVKNNLHVQVWLLTDFWQRVRDAEPVAFTFVRDGIPFYDRGTFIPWKLLLKMGKIKPSPEAVDMFMKSGEQTENLLKRRMIDAMIDIYYGVITPTQALMMLAGQAPPDPKGMVAEVKKILVEKEKLMSLADLKILEKAIKLFKDYEHGKLSEISGTELDKFKKEHDGYVKKMKEMRGKIEERMQEYEAERVQNEIFDLTKSVFGNKSRESIIKDFDSELVKKGKVPRRMLQVIRNVSEIKHKIKGKKKLSPTEMQKFTAEANELISVLTEYAQRKELVAIEKSLIQVKGKKGNGELMVTDKETFLVQSGKISKIVGKKLVDSNEEELREASKKAKDSLKVSLSGNVFSVLQKELGDFEIVL